MQMQQQWPVGTSLRFTAEIARMPYSAQLAGSAVIVLSEPQMQCQPQAPDAPPQLRQLVYSFAAGGEGWVLPEHLEPLPLPGTSTANPGSSQLRRRGSVK